MVKIRVRSRSPNDAISRVTVAEGHGNRFFNQSVPGDALRLGQGNVARRKVDMKNIAENELHGASLRPNHQINTPGVGCYLLLKLTVADEQDRGHSNAKRQKKNI